MESTSQGKASYKTEILVYQPQMDTYRNIASSLKMMKRSIGSGLHAISHMYHHQRHQTQEIHTNTQGII